MSKPDNSRRSETTRTAAERTKKSRANLAASGAVRLDFSLDAQAGLTLDRLMERWKCRTRKEAISRAIEMARKTIE